MSPTLGRRSAALAILSLLSALVVVVLPARTAPAEASTGKWTGYVDCYGGSVNTGLFLEKWDKVSIEVTGNCFFYSSGKSLGEGIYSKIGPRDFAYKAPASGVAPTNGEMRLFFQDSNYNDNFGDGFKVTVTVNKDVEKCKLFHAKVRYEPVRIRAIFRGARTEDLPAPIRPVADFVLQSRYLAFAKVHGTWCYKNGEVTRYENFRYEDPLLTGAGLLSFALAVKRTSSGVIGSERYGTYATRYVITNINYNLTASSPVNINLPLPGGGSFNIPAGSRDLGPSMVLSMVLTGSGNASCVNMESSPCEITTETEYTRRP